MSAYRPYPKYKPSGVAWLGDVPVGWHTSPVFADFRRVKETNYPGLQLLSVYRDYGVIPKASREDNFNKASDDLGAYQRIQQGDLVLNKMKAWQGSIGVSSHEGIVSPAYFTYRPTSNSAAFEPNYLHHLVRSLEYIAFYLSRSKGIRVNQWDLDPDEFRSTPLIRPPLPEQLQIASFLDRECGNLDALQAKAERLIELLKEKRQALISHAVTRGLDPNSKLKPSGVEWLGDVPEHWTTPQLKFLVYSMDQGKSPECEARQANPDEWGVLKSGCVNWGIFREEEHKALPAHIAPTIPAEIRSGDLLMSRASGSTDLIGSVAYVKRVRPYLMLSDKVFRLKPSKRSDPRFIWRLAGSTPIREQIKLCINGAEGLANNITKESVRGLLLTFPPLPEQRAIVAHLDEKCGKIDELKAKAERAIALLKERRSALISAAVTGKIDVREN